MTIADELAKAVDVFLCMGYYVSPCENLDCHHPECDLQRALAAYDARKKPTVEEVAVALSDAMYYPGSWKSNTETERNDLMRLGRAAMRVMGGEL